MNRKTVILGSIVAAILFAELWIEDNHYAFAAPAKEASASKAKLIGEPKVAKSAIGYTISFTVSNPCDVTVRITKSGEAVRHLASGMVGLKKAVQPFSAGSLSQSITWNGQDDSGKEIEVSNDCKVLIAVGVNAKFDKFILGERDGYKSWRSDALTIVKGNGDEYLVTQSGGVHLNTTRVFDSKGKFVRMVWPPSINKSKEKLQRFITDSSIGMDNWDGSRVPTCVNHNSTYYAGTSHPATVAPDGSVIGIHNWCSDYLGLWMVDPDGFICKWVWRPPWQPAIENTFTKNLWKFAFDKEGNVIFADGFHHVVGYFKIGDMSPINSFVYSGKEKLSSPRNYIGEVSFNSYAAHVKRRHKLEDKPVLDDESHFSGPNDVAVDKDDNILVLDGDKVKVYKKDGSFIKTAEKTAFPDKSFKVPPPILDAGKNPRAFVFPGFLKVDSKGQLYLGYTRSDIDGKEFKEFNMSGFSGFYGYSAIDSENNWYLPVMYKKTVQIWKVSPKGERLKFGTKDAINLEYSDAEPFSGIKGLFVAKNSDIYVVSETDKWKVTRDVTKILNFGDLVTRGEKICQTKVDIYGADGSLKKKGAVKSVGINDVAVDKEGNIYVIDGTMWHGAQMTTASQGGSPGGKKAWPMPYLTPEETKLDLKKEWPKIFTLFGRLLKFSPEGGVLDSVDGKPQIWNHAGVSGVSPWNCGGECPAAQICLDSDERLWVPDAYMYQIKAVDKAGNLILRVGNYGNEDCNGGGGDKILEGTKVIIDPEIPLARPSGIAVYKDYLFISDMYAHRVMRCKLEYNDKKEVAVP